MPDKARFKVKTYFFAKTTGALALPGAQIYFRGCSPGSPQTGQVGGITIPTIAQPYTWDQLATFYNRYICYGSSVKMRAFNDNGFGGASNMLKYVLIPSENTSDFTVAAGNFTKTVNNKYCSAIGRYSADGFGSMARARYVKKYMTFKKINGIKGIDDFTVSTTFGAAQGSTYDFWWNFLLYPFDETSTPPAGICVEGTIKYYGVALDRIILNPS